MCEFNKKYIIDGVRNSDMTFAGTPSSSDSLTENTEVIFTCTANANPAQYIAIWTLGKSQKIAESTGQTELTKSLVMTKAYNGVGIFCEATGTDPEYDVNSGDNIYDVLCKFTFIIYIQYLQRSTTR